MNLTYSLKFVDDKLNHELISLLAKAGVKHRIGKEGIIHYSPDDEEVVGNKILPGIRNKLFSSWQIISCPQDWAERYRRYMIRHDVSFVEELIDNQMCFLVSRRHRPHSWQLEESEDVARLHPIRRKADLGVIKRLCHILIEKRRGKTLADEILRDLDTGYISDETYRRLSRWCNPARSEPDAQPIAEKISKQLFGDVIRRKPSHEFAG
jgi:hypothetical protein